MEECTEEEKDVEYNKWDKEIGEIRLVFDSDDIYGGIYNLLESYFKEKNAKIRRLQEKLDSCRAGAQCIIETLGTGDKK